MTRKFFSSIPHASVWAGFFLCSLAIIQAQTNQTSIPPTGLATVATNAAGSNPQVKEIIDRAESFYQSGLKKLEEKKLSLAR
ncbi:MAG: hypothetical protein ACRD63_04410, partial [Pyrinomonadaceae bacterium]